MEGGSPFFEYVTYAMVGVVLCALGFLFLRTTWFFLSLLAIPFTEAMSRWAPFARVLERWGERGARRDPTSWQPRTSEMPHALASSVRMPVAVRRGSLIGATLGALPGLWFAVRGAVHTQRAGGSFTEIAAAIGIAIGLVAAAGAFVGAALGAGAGLAWDALGNRRRD